MRYLVIDCETSGLSCEKNKVLTIGMLNAQITKDKLKIIDSDHILVKHDNYNANPFALRINKINLEEHHKNSVYPKFACKKINSFIEDNSLKNIPILGHNINFDIRFLKALHMQAKKEYLLPNTGIDTMQIWRYLKSINIIPNYHNSTLKTISNYFDIDNSQAHNALEDAKITAQVYHKLLNYS